MEKVPLTARGFAKLDAELKKLKSVERPAIIAVSPDTRGAVRAIGGNEFLASQVDELRLIREQGLADYYSR